MLWTKYSLVNADIEHISQCLNFIQGYFGDMMQKDAYGAPSCGQTINKLWEVLKL